MSEVIRPIDGSGSADGEPTGAKQALIILDLADDTSRVTQGLSGLVAERTSAVYSSRRETPEEALAALNGINADPRHPLNDFEINLGRMVPPDRLLR